MVQDTRTAQQLARVRQMARSGQARRIRQAALLSQAEIAAHVGVSASAVARWEGGSRMPHGEEAILWLELLTSLAVDLAGAESSESVPVTAANG